MIGLQLDIKRYRLQMDNRLSPQEVDTLTRQLFTKRVRLCARTVSITYISVVIG